MSRRGWRAWGVAMVAVLTVMVTADVVGAATCSQTAQALKAARMEAARRWVERVNEGRDLYLSVSNELLTEDGTFTVKAVGSFSPKNIVVEYGLSIFPLFGVPAVKFHQTWDPYRTSWLSADRLELHAVQRASLRPDPVTGQYAVTLDDLHHHEILDFEACTARIRFSFVINDPILQKLFETPPVLDAAQICGGIFLACPVGTPLQQYTDFADCVAFMNAIPPSACPFPFTSHTLLCRSLHLEQAFINPAVHCPHVGKDSPTCRERCLPACDSCSPDATCRDEYIDITTPNFKCECNDGFTGSGTQCAANVCQTRKDCPADRDLAVCGDDGVCGCADEVRWNPDPKARKKKDTCGCDEGERLTQRPDGTPACVPLGRCFDAHDCPQSHRVVECVETPGNPLDTSNVCECNYGYSGGRESDCVCPAPRREVKVKDPDDGHAAKVCLAPTECVRDRDCGKHERCEVPTGELVGACVADQHHAHN